MSIAKEMLKDKDIKGWYDEMRFTGAEITATTYLRRLSAILKRIDETPNSFVDMNEKDRYDKMMTFAIEEQNLGRAPSYIISEFKAIYSFLRHKGIFFKRIPNPKNASSTPTVADEIIPDTEEMEKILQVAKPRDKVSICLMAFSGVRPAVIGDHHGNNGLTIGEIDGLSIQEGIVTVDPPLKITISDILSKTSHKYFSFLCNEGAHHLKTYLEIRIKAGEKITSASPVVRSIEKAKMFICTGAIQHGIKSSFIKAGIEKRPYVLRRYFASKMLLGEYNGIMPHSFSQFMMGHKGEMMDQYTLHKGLLPEQVQNMKDAYQNCDQYLETGTSRKEINDQNIRINQMETDNKTVEKILIGELKDQSKLQEEFETKIKELEFNNYKLSSAKDEAKNETVALKNEFETKIGNLQSQLSEQQKFMYDFVRDIRENGFDAKPRDETGRIVKAKKEKIVEISELDLPPEYRD